MNNPTAKYLGVMFESRPVRLRTYQIEGGMTEEMVKNLNIEIKEEGNEKHRNICQQR